MANSLKRALICVWIATFGVSAAAAQPKKAPAPAATPAPAGEGSRTTSKMSVSGKPMHLSCNRSLRNLKTNKIECFGNVYIRRPTELLTADYAIMDMNTEDMHAEGNVVYFTGNTVLYGAKMDFNFTTETGIIEDGRIENERYELLGENIERYSEDEFKIYDGEYTTCRDCPASWRLAAKNVDFKVDGYAYMTQVFVKVNEAPMLYMPAVVIPVKTKRQTGFLFPRFGTSQSNGFMFVEPFFWAISRSTDATLGYGRYTNRGTKGEAEFRYVLTSRSKGEVNGYYLQDKTFPLADYQRRWAFDTKHNLELPEKIEFKLHGIDASDRDYARLFPEDIKGFGEPALVSEAGLSRAGRSASIWASAKRIRNNITPDLVGFDRNTVQVAPSVSVATVDHRMGDNLPLHWGISSNYTKFWRKGPSFDGIYPPDSTALTASAAPVRTDFLPGQTPIRRADRYMITPELYYTARVADVFELVPKVQYRQFVYTFDTQLAPTSTRGYLLTQTDFATTVEKVYSGKVKHKVRPSITYSAIPIVNRDTNHPFNKQLATSGYEFDENDIVPLTNENQLYFVPLGNSLSWQVGNKFILKSDEAPYKYNRTVDITSGQSIDLLEYRKNMHERKPLSRFFTFANVQTLRVQGTAEYFYYPYVRSSTYNLSSNYIFAQYTKRLLAFQRSVGLSYSYNQVTTHSNSIGLNTVYSWNDYWQLNGGGSYQFPMGLNSAISPGILLSVTGGVTFMSPSQCYRIIVQGTRTFGVGYNVTASVPINLSGAGFTNFADSGSVAGATTQRGT